VTSELQWLNFCIDEARHFGFADKAAALERLRARLTPDRERVAMAIMDVLNDNGWETDRHDRPALLQAADAAIDAAQAAPPATFQGAGGSQ